MDIGLVREVKADEYRVGLTPASVQELVRYGHRVVVETGAGAGIGIADDDYQQAGAELLVSAAQVFQAATLIVKVKEPQPQECQLLEPRHILFTFLHLAADQQLTKRLLHSGASCIAYETVSDPQGALPLLAPMSEIAGRFSVQAAAHHLQCAAGGSGVLLSGACGVAPAKVLVLGGGVVGSNAARIAVGMGAQVSIVDRSLARLRQLDAQYQGRVNTLYSTEAVIEQQLPHSDVVIGAVLIPGARAPKLVSRSMLALIQRGSVLVDVAIDQGGCLETSRATTHGQPTFVLDGVIHYCVANMPGAVARTASFALNNASLPYVLALANHGLQAAMQADKGLAAGLNVHRGRLCCAGVAEAFGLNYDDPQTALSAASNP